MSNRALTLWLIDDDDPIALLHGPLHNDAARARDIATRIYGDAVLIPVASTDLATAMAAVSELDNTHPYALVGAYGSARVVSSSLFDGREPSTLTATVISLGPTKVATLLHTEPGEALGVFARWEGGELRRSFSANPIDIYEDSGLPFVFESPFWGGEYPLQYAEGVAPQPLALPFHPAQLAEHANREWLGFRFTPPAFDGDVDPTRIPVTAFAIHPAGYVPTGDEEALFARRLETVRVSTAPRSAAPVGPPPADVVDASIAVPTAEASGDPSAHQPQSEPTPVSPVVAAAIPPLDTTAPLPPGLPAEVEVTEEFPPVATDVVDLGDNPPPDESPKVGRVRSYFGFGPRR